MPHGAGGLLSPVMSDPVLLFVLLTEACMPSAQVRLAGMHRMQQFTRRPGQLQTRRPVEVQW